MSPLDKRLTRGAVVAVVVATAPGAVSGAGALLWRSVFGRQVVAWTLAALRALGELDTCIVVAPPERHDDVARMIVHEAPARLSGILPGATDTWLGDFPRIENIPPTCEWVVVLDAALPLVTPDAIHAGLRAAERTGVAIAGEPVKETLKRVEGEVVAETLPRDALRRLVTPLVLRREALAAILGACDPSRDDTHDLVSLVQLAGVPITVYEAGYPAVRVNSEDDLAIVETLLLQRLSEAHPS